MTKKKKKTHTHKRKQKEKEYEQCTLDEACPINQKEK